MIEDRVREAGPAPGEAEARARAWELAAAAAAERPRQPPPRRRAPTAAALALTAAALTGAVAFTAPGDAVADWLTDRVRDAVGEPAPIRGDHLPGDGLLLGASSGGPVVVGGGDRPKRLLGAVDEATWSPRALHVAATRGVELIAVDRRGQRRWSLHHGQRIVHPRWAPSGFRIAYLSSHTLWVVNGDGTTDRPLGLAGPAAPAWRPGRRHQIAYADTAGRVVLLQVRDDNTARVLWRTRPHLTPRKLAFSADGDRLVVMASDRTYVLTAKGHGALIRHARVPAGTHNADAAFARRGRDYAVVRHTRAGTSRIVLVRAARVAGRRAQPVDVGYGRDRLLLELPGPTRGLAWSPDGRWLAVAAQRADAWLLLRVRDGRLAGVRTIDRVRSRFGAGAPVSLAGWCCPA
jgi:hypothetical protein